MKNSTKHATKFKAVLKKLKAADPVLPSENDPVTVLAFAFCAWESTSEKALDSCRKLRKSLVDWNDLRVCKPEEIVEMAGFNDAHKIERARRLRSSLHAVFLREHETCLDSLREMKKREARDYIESLDGMVPYVSSFVLMHCCDVQGVPVDDQMRRLLLEKGAVDETADVSEVGSWLSRQINSDESSSVSARLQHWADQESARLAKDALADMKQDSQNRKRQVAKLEAEKRKVIQAAEAEAKKKG